MTGKEVIAKLKAAGWSIDRIHGSHCILTKDGKAVPVPVHVSRDPAPVFWPRYSANPASS